MVGLDDQMAGPLDVALHVVCDLTGIGDETEIGASGLDEVAGIVAAVVRYVEGSYQKVAQLVALSFLNGTGHVGCYFLGNAVVAVDAGVNLGSSIDRTLVVVAEGAYGLDMVSMVVGDEHVVYLTEVDPILATGFLQPAQPYPKVYEQGVVRRLKQVTVSTASTTK